MVCGLYLVQGFRNC